MRAVPRNITPQIDFFKAHVPQWEAEAGTLRLDPGDVARLRDRLAAVEEAFAAQSAALQEARAATAHLHAQLNAMRREGAAVIRQVRAQAQWIGTQAYTLAQIDPPAKATPVAEPGTPYAFTTTLTTNGTVGLTWKCDNPKNARGTTYHLSRRLDIGARGEPGGGGGGGGWEFLGTAGRRRFEDATLPPGTRQAEYRVQAVRSTCAGPKATHTVTFGFDCPGLPVPGNMQLATEMARAA